MGKEKWPLWGSWAAGRGRRTGKRSSRWWAQDRETPFGAAPLRTSAPLTSGWGGCSRIRAPLPEGEASGGPRGLAGWRDQHLLVSEVPPLSAFPVGERVRVAPCPSELRVSAGSSALLRVAVPAGSRLVTGALVQSSIGPRAPTEQAPCPCGLQRGWDA